MCQQNWFKFNSTFYLRFEVKENHAVMETRSAELLQGRDDTYSVTAGMGWLLVIIPRESAP